MTDAFDPRQGERFQSTASRRAACGDPYYRKPWFPPLALAAMLAIAAAVWLVGRHPWNVPPTPPSSVARPPRSGDPRPDPPITVQQEANGDINLSPSLASLEGGQLELEIVGLDEVLAGWGAGRGVARWCFVVRKLPPGGVFRALVTYAADEDGGVFTLRLAGQEYRGRTRARRGFATDEYLVSVPRTGEHELTLGGTASSLRVKWISLCYGVK